MDILEECPVGDMKYLGEAEQFWISQIQGFGHSLKNMSLGGESGSYGARWTLTEDQIRRGIDSPMYGKSHTDEAKKLISSAKLGTKRSEDSRRRQGESISGENHWAYGGGKFSTSHRLKIAESRRGQVASESTRESMSNAKKGIPLSEEHRNNISLAISGPQHHNYGKPAFNKGKPSISAHTRWHTNKNISKPETCDYCKETIDKRSYQLESH